SFDGRSPPVGDATEGEQHERDNEQVKLNVGHGFSLPRTACAMTCSPTPATNQATAINHHHLLAAAVGDPYKKPTIGAMMAVTTVATPMLLRAVATSLTRSLWTRLHGVAFPTVWACALAWISATAGSIPPEAKAANGGTD